MIKIDVDRVTKRAGVGHIIKNINEDIYVRLRAKCAGKRITVEQGVIEAVDKWAKRKEK